MNQQPASPERPRRGLFSWRTALIALAILIVGVAGYSLRVAYHEPDAQNTIVLGQNAFYADSPASLRIVVQHGVSKRPVSHAQVQIRLHAADRSFDLGASTTDQDGSVSPAFRIPSLTAGKYELALLVTSALGRDEIKREIEIKAPARLYLTTDKPIYQPGQTLHMRAMALHRISLLPLAVQPITFELEDPKGNKVFRETRLASKYGIAAVDFPIADEVNMGRYKISLQAGGNTAEKTVTVKRYVLPKFKTTVTAGQSYYLPSETVSGQVAAAYFFGKPLDRAQVKLTARTHVEKTADLTTLTGPTDGAGNFAFTLKLPDYFTGMPLAGGDAFLELAATVTDAAGHEETSSLRLIVARQPIRILALPENGKLVPGVANRIFILTAYPDGQPAACRIKVNNAELHSDQSGVALYKLVPSTNVSLQVEATDGQGRVGRETIAPAVGTGAASFVFRTDRAVYAGGQSVAATILSGIPEATFFLDVIKEGQTVLTKTLDVRKGEGTLNLDLPAGLFGTLKLNAYTISPDGESVAQSRLIRVNQPDQLQIQAVLDKPVHRPGETARVNFEVKDRQNRPAPAALGLSVVDEAVFHLSENRPGLLEQFFLADEQLLQPMYQIKFSVSPGKLWGGLEEDQPLAEALFTAAVIPDDTAKSLEDLKDKLSPAMIDELKNNDMQVYYRQLLIEPRYSHLAGLFESKGDYSFRTKTFPDKKAAMDKSREYYFSILLHIIIIVIVCIINLFIIRVSFNKVYRLVCGYDDAIGLTPLQALVRRALTGIANASDLIIILPFVLLFTGLLISCGIWAIVSIWSVNIEPEPGWLFSAWVGLSIFIYVTMVILQFKWCAELRHSSEAARVGNRMIIDPILYACILVVGALLFVGFIYQIRGCGILFAFYVPAIIIYSLVAPIFIGSLTSLLAAQYGVTIERKGRGIEIIVVIFVIALLAGLLLPNLASVHSSARKVMAMNDLNALDTALMAEGAGEEESLSSPRIREYFPETLFWQPELITDDNGRADLALPLADSITTWRMNADAVSGGGLLGSRQLDIPVFQDFFVDLDLPVALTRNDEVSIPVACYNYLKQAQTLRLTLEAGDGCGVQGASEQILNLAPNEVKSASFRIKAREVGLHPLTVTARGGAMSDAVRRQVEVRPDGTQQEQLQNATLRQSAAHTVVIPLDAIPNSVRLLLKVYPSSFSEVVEGLDAIFEMPHGCFEQTSSSTYPNVLALRYMKEMNQITPEIEIKARKYITAGYQRLLTFEIAGGGFELFGHPPANEMLTAYGLLEFTDMATVHAIDPAVLDRSAKWLLSKQKSNGAWGSDKLAHSWQDVSGEQQTTAYIAWALAEARRPSPQLDAALNYLRTNITPTNQAYTLALAANALLADNPKDSVGLRLAEALQAQFVSDTETAHLASKGRGAMYSYGPCLDIETTALATLALMKSGQYPEIIKKALTWILRQKDPRGTWHSTQATILAMKALLAGTGKALGGDAQADLAIAINEQLAYNIQIKPETSDLLQVCNLTKHLRPGTNTVTLSTKDKAVEIPYQLAATWWVPWAAPAAESPKELSIKVDYDRTSLAVNDVLKSTVTVQNNQPAAIQMAIIDLGIPPGFRVDTAAFEKLVQSGVLAKYEVTGNQCILYVRGIPAEKPIRFTFDLKAMYPIKAQSPASRVYEYYNPQNQAKAMGREIVVRGE